MSESMEKIKIETEKTKEKKIEEGMQEEETEGEKISEEEKTKIEAEDREKLKKERDELEKVASLEKLQESINNLKETCRKLVKKYDQVLKKIRDGGIPEKMRQGTLTLEDKKMIEEWKRLQSAKKMLEMQIKQSEENLKRLEELEKGKLKVETELRIPREKKDSEK